MKKVLMFLFVMLITSGSFASTASAKVIVKRPPINTDGPGGTGGGNGGNGGGGR